MNEPLLSKQLKLILQRLETISQTKNAVSQPVNIQKFQNEWLDGQQVMQLLNISNRELQTYRDKGILPFSQISKKKIFYRFWDVWALVEKHLQKKQI